MMTGNYGTARGSVPLVGLFWSGSMSECSHSSTTVTREWSEECQCYLCMETCDSCGAVIGIWTE